jgi:hypothetical protein
MTLPSGGDGGGGDDATAAVSPSTNPSPKKPSPSSSSPSKPPLSTSSSRDARRGGGRPVRKKTRAEKVGSDEARRKTPKVYDVGVTCKKHWQGVVQKMLEPWKEVWPVTRPRTLVP